MTKIAEPVGAIPTDRSFFGQPRSLANIFGVEMWERFSFYGMQGILLLYLYYSVAQGGLGIPQSTAAGIVGAYGGGVYLSAILGAFVADRLLGSERVLFFSAVVIMLGHIALALLPGVPGVVAGLILIAVGSGGLKANATSVVGAAIGMTIGLVQYSFGRKGLPDAVRQVPHPLPRSRWSLFGAVAAVGVALIVVLVLLGAITASNLVNIVIGLTVFATVPYFVVSPHEPPGDFGRAQARVRVHPAVHRECRVLVALPAAVHRRHDLRGRAPGPRHLRLDDAGVVGAVVQPGLRHPAVRRLRGALDQGGLSVATKLAPEPFKTQMVALFFLSIALGSAVSGVLAQWYATVPEGVYFGVLGGIAILLGLLLALIARPVLRLMGGVR